jgi:hypothetical protein
MKQFFISLFVAASLVAGGYAFGAECTIERTTHGKIKRSSYQVAKFKKLNPCPATGRKTGSCPGYQIDHIDALECCGKDVATNMQWLTIAQHREKTKLDNVRCKGANK